MIGLVACGGSKSNTESSDAGSKTSSETKKEKSDFSNLKIGALLTGSDEDTSGYSFAHVQGIKSAARNLGINEDHIVWKNFISDTMDNSSDEQVKAAIEGCINDGCKLIFSTSYGYKNVTKSMAAKHPDVYFAHATGDISNGTNFINYFGRVYQARYLSGIAAGLKTKSNKVGFVSAWGIENSECSSNINAFAMGVASVNPDAKVYVSTTDSWFDAKKEKAAAKSLLKKGCDVIAQHVDTAEPQIAAEEAGAFGIGYNSDMTKDAPDAVLTSVIWNWDVFYTWAMKAVGEKTWDGKNYLGGLNEGMVGVTKLTALNHPDAEKLIQDATDKMKSGDWDVFTGVIPTNKKTTVGSEDSSLDDDDILFGTNWYYKNVVTLDK
ncbi:MAG: BMP family ABC transporter substrate-binding protein [Lachnospiraceae bacterium]|nr:BMP family ABC transporter substrate-binding protein [Lachnospiraceae bacterium]